MASKRQLKKRISRICGDLASDILLASHFEGVDREKVRGIICEIATLQEEARSKATFGYDKVAKDFENRALYNAAHSKYNQAAFAKLREEFGTKAAAIVKEMNEAIPAKVREAVATLG